MLFAAVSTEKDKRVGLEFRCFLDTAEVSVMSHESRSKM